MVNLHLKQLLQFSGPAPEESGNAVILIHGRTQSPKEMFSLAERIALPSVSYIALQANENSWYPAKFMQPLDENQPFLDHSLEAVDKAIEKLNAKGLVDRNIILLGFSQGACLACEYAYRNPKRWGGLIAFTGGLIGPEKTIWPVAGNFEGMPVFLGNSTNDDWVPLSRTADTAKVFGKMGAKVNFKAYPYLDHSVNDNEISLARSLLENIAT